LLAESKVQTEILDSCDKLLTPFSCRHPEGTSASYLMEPIGYFKNSDRSFILPVVEYSNIVYLYNGLCKKLILANELISFKSIKTVRYYIDNYPLEKLHKLCIELANLLLFI
jgi:hypothetical protein